MCGDTADEAARAIASPLLTTPHTLPLNIQPPHLPPPLPPQRLPHLIQLPDPKPQKSPLFHLHSFFEDELRLYSSKLVFIAEETELDSVISGMANDVISARADLVEQVRGPG